MDDVREIMAGLTKAQRAALVDAFDVGDGSRSIWGDVNRNAAYALHRKGLVDDHFILTPLGLRVRAPLVGERG